MRARFTLALRSLSRQWTTQALETRSPDPIDGDVRRRLHLRTGGDPLVYHNGGAPAIFKSFLTVLRTLHSYPRTVPASTIDAYHTTYTLYPPMNSISFPTPQIPSPNSIAGCLPPISHTPLEDIAHASSVVMDAGIYQYDFTVKHGHERYPQEARRGEEDQVHWRDVGSAAHTNASIRRRRSCHEPGASYTCPKCRKSFTRAHNLHGQPCGG